MKIKWTNPTASGLCDRLLDLMLISAYAKVYKSELYLNWITGSQTSVNRWIKEPGVVREWDEVRYQDYKYENYSQYFTLPKNIFINIDCNPDYVFNNYLGGIYSPHSFYEKFINDPNITIDDYLKAVYETFDEFKPTQKLLDLTKNLPKPELSIHLRRADKVRIDPDPLAVNLQELESLNNLTMQVLEKFNKSKLIYIASDDQKEKEKYASKYESIVDKNEYLIFEKTYVDIYMLSQSDYIILSQKHSNFSMFSSLLNRNKLIYLYRDSAIDINKFNLLDNIIYYKDIKQL